VTSLGASYDACRQLNKAHGRTYYLSTWFLPKWKRHHVHALYGFARYADDIVDASPDTTPGARATALKEWSEQFLAALDSGDTGDDILLPALLHTKRAFGIPTDVFRAFLASMEADLTVTRYPTFDDLMGYMYGSAAAIGLWMLPVLETAADVDAKQAAERAMDLGVAFQLTNFLRDVKEDFGRGRIYIPLEDLDRFGVSEEHIAAGRVDGAWTDLMRFEIARTRDIYTRADEGIAMLHPTSRPCVTCARVLYSGILDAIEGQGYDVFAARASVPASRKLAVAARALLARSQQVIERTTRANP
jgi:phytoene synthase